MKTKSKIHTDIKNLVLAKAQQYTRNIQKTVESSDEEVDNTADLLEKAAEKEKKREKMRLKKMRKREAREKSVKKDISEARKLAIDYLNTWNSSRDSWSFKKNLQSWLLKNIFSTENIIDKDFEILLNYIIELKGGAKSRLNEECESVIKSYEHKSEEDMNDEDLVKFERARSIIQILV